MMIIAVGQKGEPMSDLIDRQAAIDAVNSLTYPSSLMDVKMKLIELPSAQPEQRWIPVGERLPEEGQACLVADKGSITIDTYIGHGNPYNWRWYVRDYEAWQPLPEPYRNEI